MPHATDIIFRWYSMILPFLQQQQRHDEVNQIAVLITFDTKYTPLT